MAGSIINSICFIIYIFLGFVLTYIYYHILLKQQLIKLLKPKIGLLVLLASSSFFIISGITLYTFNIYIIFINIFIIAYTITGVFVIYSLWLKYISKIPLDLIIYDTDDLIIVLDIKDRIIYLNNTAISLLPKEGISKIIGSPISDFLPEFNQIISKKPGKIAEIKINSVLYRIKMFTKLNKESRIIGRTLLFRDISQLVQVKDQMAKIEKKLGTRVSERTEELEKTNTVLLREIDEHRNSEVKLRSSLEEKNILLSEVHHRVKNNLQVINSLLKLQTKYIEDETALDAFNTAVSRIRSIAMIHEKLYKSENLSNANFSEYIHELAQSLISSHRNNDISINLIVNVENIFLDIDASVLCGLIINELIINTLKYAFPENRADNEIRINFISMQKSQDNVYGTGFGFELTVSDNGTGLPEELDIENSETLGFKIITTLVKQLKGTILVNSNNGTLVKINF